MNSYTTYIGLDDYTTSSVFSTGGHCATTFGGAVSLETVISFVSPAGLSSGSLTQSIEEDIRDYLGVTNCFVNAQIEPAALNTSVTLPAADVTSSSTVLSSQPASSTVGGTTSTGETTVSKPVSQSRTARIATSIVLSVLGALAIALGGFLVLRRRRKARQKQDSGPGQADSESEPSVFFQKKPELDAEQQRHEMEAERERCELEGESSRQEMNAETSDEERRGRISTLQELRGVKPSHELDAENKEPAETFNETEF